LQETRLGIQLAKKQSTKQQSTKKTIGYTSKQSVVYTSKTTTTYLNEFKGKKRYKNSLYWFTLQSRATSSPQNPLGNPLRNQLQTTHKNHQRSDLDPLKKHTSFGSSHTKNVDLDNLKSIQPFLALQHHNVQRIQNELHLL